MRVGVRQIDASEKVKLGHVIGDVFEVVVFERWGCLELVKISLVVNTAFFVRYYATECRHD